MATFVLSGDKDELTASINSVLRPLVSNLLRDISNPKFHTVREKNARIAAVLSNIGESRRLFETAGFVSSTNADGEPVLTFRGSHQSLMAAEAVLSATEDAVNGRSAAGSSAPQDEGLLVSKARKRVEAEHEASLAKVRAQQEVDAAEKHQLKVEEEKAAELAEAIERDFEEGKAFLETAKRTLHHTGRLRNATYTATHWAIRRMTHGRWTACSWPDDYFEVHWHSRSSNLVYTYIAHLTPDVTKVVGVGEEHGYQYNTLPGTEHFGKTVWMSRKKVNSETGVVELNENPNMPVESCKMCGMSFNTIWI